MREHRGWVLAPRGRGVGEYRVWRRGAVLARGSLALRSALVRDVAHAGWTVATLGGQALGTGEVGDEAVEVVTSMASVTTGLM